MKGNHTEQVAKLVDRYGQMVFATTYRILGCADDAEDALQDVFLKLMASWNGRLKPDRVRDWGAYLRVAASRSAVDLLRRKRRSWKRKSGKLIEEIEAPADQNPRATAIQRQRARLLRQALSSLPKRDAQIFALRYFEELSYEEIAEQMGITVNSIGVVLHRTRERLQKIIEPLLADNSQQTEIMTDPSTKGKEKGHVTT